MTLLKQSLAVAYKDLLTEWRQPSRIAGVFFFCFALLLLFAFAMPNTQMLSDIAGGTLWLGLLLASTRSLDQSFHLEMENGALEGMVLWPVPPLAMFYGKALANALLLTLVTLALTPLVVVLYHPVWNGDIPTFLGIVALGCLALAAPGTLVAALSVQARGSSALLPLLMFPLVVPVVVAASKATTLHLEGDIMSQVDDWMRLLVMFNLAHWALDGWLFTRIAEDG